MYDHAKSKKFNWEFDIVVLDSYSTRSESEEAEEKFIEEYDTYYNGLNATKGGKGWGHNSPKFTTLGYKYSEESKRKMSESAKARAEREGFEQRSIASKRGWENGGEEYRKHMSDIRKGKRLRKPKLTDDQVEEIRKDFEKQKDSLEKELNELIPKYKKKGWKQPSIIGLYYKHNKDKWKVSNVLIAGIIKGTHRKCPLPSLYQS